MGARFSAPVQTGPGAYQASCTMGTGSFPGVKRPGRDADHPPASSKSNPITGLDRPLVLQEVEAHRFIDNRHIKVVRLSALRTGRLYPQESMPRLKKE